MSFFEGNISISLIRLSSAVNRSISFWFVKTIDSKGEASTTTPVPETKTPLNKYEKSTVTKFGEFLNSLSTCAIVPNERL